MPSSKGKTTGDSAHRGEYGPGRTRFPVLLLLLLLLLLATGMHLFLDRSEDVRNSRIPLGAGIHDRLMNELVMENPVAPISDAASRKSVTMIYVLGSTQNRLKYHYRTAADLHKKGVSDRIFILSRPGFTEYSTKLLRNLTNDEWSVMELGGLGVRPDDVEAVPVPSGFFGTYSEGRTISRFARDRGYQRLVLVSSHHHARRVLLTFSHFLGDSMEVYFEGSGDPAGMFELLVEYGKYFWYQRILIPVAGVASQARKGVATSRKGFSLVRDTSSAKDRNPGADRPRNGEISDQEITNLESEHILSRISY